MPRRILVPLDGSPLSEEVVPWVDELAAALDAEVELIRVLERDSASDAVAGEVAFNERLSAGSTTTPPSVSSMQAEASEKDARLELARVRSRFQQTPSIDLNVLEGDPAQAIVQRVGAVDASLIAMATHGRTGIARTVLGSVAGRVVGHSPVPVLIVRSGLTMPAHRPERVLAALDTSDFGAAALQAVQPIAQELRWRIILFHALDLPAPTLPVQGAAIPLGLPPSHAPDAVMTYLEALANNVKADGLEVEIRLGAGHAADATVRGAEETGAGIIVMSTHGRSGVARWLLGSVAEDVIARAHIPVLVLRPPRLSHDSAEEGRNV
jgi:nucleotide-binding universal stress UspA family protein